MSGQKAQRKISHNGRNWRPSPLYPVLFLCITAIGFFLLYEYRTNILTSSIILVVTFGACLALYFLVYGGSNNNNKRGT